MLAYRVGSHWPETIIRVELDEAPDEYGRRPSDELMAMAKTPDHAASIVAALNATVTAGA